MGERIQGPQCQVRNWFDDEMDPGTTALTTHRTPGHHHHHRKITAPPNPIKLPVIVFDEKLMMEFLRTSARAKVMARHISIVYTTPKSPSWGEVVTQFAVNATAGFYGIEGSVEEGITSVAFGDESKIEAEAKKGLNELIATFNERFQRSVGSGCRFLNEQERERARNVAIVQAFYDEVVEVNHKLRHDLLHPLKVLIAVKLAATIGFKLGSLFVTKGWYFLTGIAYDVSTELISEWDKAEQAKVVVMAGSKGKKRLAVAAATEAVADSIQKVTETGSEKLAETLFEMVEHQILHETQEGLKSMFRHVAGETAEQFWKRSGDAANAMAKAQLGRSLGRAVGRGLIKGTVRGIQGLWFGKDVVLAYWTAKEEWKEAEEAAE